MRGLPQTEAAVAVLPPGFREYCLLAGMRRSRAYAAALPAAAEPEVREWLRSWGQRPPMGPEVAQPSLQSQAKWIAAGEGWVADPALLRLQLDVCFKDRTGDVYARPVEVPPPLSSGGTIDAFFAPVGESVAALQAALRTSPK